MNRNRLRLMVALVLAISFSTTKSQTTSKTIPTPETAKPGIRWWWLGSAVDSTNLRWNLEQFAKAGIGAVEITPIYGVQDNEAKDISYLSPRWLKELRNVEGINAELGIETNMATGTGWPFGGPWVPISEAACKAVVIDTLVDAATPLGDIVFALPERERSIAKPIAKKEYGAEGGKKRVIALYESRTRQMVKRAAPGGEGYVVDHFDAKAVANYLAHIDSAFAASGTAFPPVLFNDSYEVYGANWTPTLPYEFERRHGYSLIDRLREFVDGDAKVVSDYRETLAHMLLNNFTRQWTDWAHSHGAKTRNQAHGSPANLIDCYAAVDIPEIEGFGLTDFGIKGLRRDSGFTRRNDSDLSMLKYAPSAAHITGKKLTSSETFTWLTEHFRTSLSQMKPDLDLMFCAGVNRMFFHGAAYSPKDDPWPGWRFYASVDMSPTNSIWRDAPELMNYITRCQTYLQWGQPDNDFLVYLPVRDLWKNDTRNWLMQFDIHSMARKAPQFIKTILDIDKAGFDCDYISDQYLLTTTYKNGMLQTAAGTRYKGIIIPANATLPDDVARHIEQLRQQGAHIILGDDTAAMEKAAKPEAMKKELGLKMIRRSNDEGHHYFIANLTDHDINARIALATDEPHAYWVDPMTNEMYNADLNAQGIAISLRSGESRILVSSNSGNDLPAEPALGDTVIDLTGNTWQLSFIEEQPNVGESFKLDGIRTWEGLSEEAATTMGTGVYETTFNLSKAEAKNDWTIDLGDVRESARVYINGKYVGCAWAVPFTLDCKGALRKGKNTLRIEVTNLPANRIADMDRKGVKWRKMKEINVVDINYKKTSYANWKPVASGLNGKVKLIIKK